MEIAQLGKCTHNNQLQQSSKEKIDSKCGRRKHFARAKVKQSSIFPICILLHLAVSKIEPRQDF